MCAILQGKYVLISRPHFDAKLETWLPYASICWDGDKFHYHQLTDIEPAFKYEIEAMAYGFVFARHWIERNGSESAYKPL